MNLLQVKNIGKAFGPRALFSEASFAVNADEKIGVIGPNGAGKTTLFKILIGSESADSGEITRASGLRIGYLAQEDRFSPGQTIADYLGTQDRTPLWDLKRMAPAMGLKESDFDRTLLSLSGGYRMRAKLLHLIGSQPDLMLLDEPTNYLDLETLVVVERFLQSTHHAFLLISHDREFLRRTTDHILEIEDGDMTKYAGNIDDYFEQKALLRDQMLKSSKSAQAKRKEVLDFAARFGAKANKARQVQSRLKQLEKMEVIEVKSLPTTAKIRIPEPARTGRMVVQTDEAVLGYPEKQILQNVRLSLEAGDHLGVVGVNGAGKSTLLKSLAGELLPLSGTFKYGMNAEVAFFAQVVAERLNPEDTVLEAMGVHAKSDVTRQQILDLAGSLLFSGDSVDKKIKVLSGGEKSRVALGQILLKKASLLLLDEPTNHLDFETVEALTQALTEYSGTVVVVSHDRGFVRRIATKILEIRDGRAEFYPGSYDEYVWSVQKGALAIGRESENTGAVSGDGSKSPVAGAVPFETKFNYKDRKKELEKQSRALAKEMETIERENEKRRAEILTLTEELMKESGAKAADLAKKLVEIQSAIDQSEQRYLECMEVQELVEVEILSLDGER